MQVSTEEENGRLILLHYLKASIQLARQLLGPCKTTNHYSAARCAQKSFENSDSMLSIFGVLGILAFGVLPF